MENNIPTDISSKIIAALLTFRLNKNRLQEKGLGLGNNTDLSKRINHSALTGLNKNSSGLLSSLNPHLKEELSNGLSSGIGKDGIKLNEDMKNYIKSFHQAPGGQDALLNEFTKRLPFITAKLNKTIGKTSPKESLETAKKVLNSEIKKCRLIVQTRIEKEKRLFLLNHPAEIQYKEHELPVTVNGRETGMSATVYEALNLDQAHKNMQGHYIDMSKTQFNSLESVVNMGNITPAALLALLLENSSKNDYVLASKLGITDLLKEHSLARFNQDKHGLEKTTQAITTRLTDYLHMKNGQIQQVGQEIQQSPTQHQGINIGI